MARGGVRVGEVGCLVYRLEMTTDLDCGPFYLPQEFQTEFPIMPTPSPRRFSF